MAGAYVDSCGMQREHQRLGERGHPAQRSSEDRFAHGCRCASLSSRSDEQTSIVARQLVDLRHARETEAVGVGRIDAADKWIDQALVYLLSEALANEQAHGIGADTRGGENWFETGSKLRRPREQIAAREFGQLGWYTEQETLWDRVHFVPPHVCRPDSGRRELIGQSELGGQARRVRHTSEECIGTLIDPWYAGERRRTNLATEAVVCLEQRDGCIRQ